MRRSNLHDVPVALFPTVLAGCTNVPTGSGAPGASTMPRRLRVGRKQVWTTLPWAA